MSRKCTAASCRCRMAPSRVCAIHASLRHAMPAVEQPVWCAVYTCLLTFGTCLRLHQQCHPGNSFAEAIALTPRLSRGRCSSHPEYWQAACTTPVLWVCLDPFSSSSRVIISKVSEGGSDLRCQACAVPGSCGPGTGSAAPRGWCRQHPLLRRRTGRWRRHRTLLQ